METKNLPVVVAVASLWLVVAAGFILTAVQVEHWMLTGWIFTLVALVAAVLVSGLAYFILELQQIKQTLKESA